MYTIRPANEGYDYTASHETNVKTRNIIKLEQKQLWPEYYQAQHAFLWSALKAGRVLVESRATCLKSLAWLESQSRKKLLEGNQ